MPWASSPHLFSPGKPGQPHHIHPTAKGSSAGRGDPSAPAHTEGWSHPRWHEDAGTRPWLPQPARSTAGIEQGRPCSPYRFPLPTTQTQLHTRVHARACVCAHTCTHTHTPQRPGQQGHLALGSCLQAWFRESHPKALFSRDIKLPPQYRADAERGNHDLQDIPPPH